MVLATTSMGLRASLDATRAGVAGMMTSLNVDEAACKRCEHGVCLNTADKVYRPLIYSTKLMI